MAPPRKQGDRAGNVTALPGVDLAALLHGLTVDAGGPDPFARTPPVPLEVPAEALAFRVCVDLEDAQPRIWRRLELAGDLTLDELHEVLQAAMGWSDSHLHAFVIGPGERGHQSAPFLTDVDVREGDEGVPEGRVRLDQVVREVGDRLYYDYDFGDGWEHRLEVEVVLPRSDDAPRATCTGGARACPPEDVGGVPGYEQVLDWLRDGPAAGPDGDWARQQLDWLPPGFDPAAFDLAAADEMVRAAATGRSPEGLTGEVGALLDRVDPTGAATVGAWAAAATRTPVDHDPQVAGDLVAPWTALLDHVADGIALTGAGYLKPASVAHLVGVLGERGRLGRHADIAFGKGNREEHVRPVGWLRGTATAAGLVRKSKGRLLPTAEGSACRTDPERLLRRLASRLPLGRGEHERDAGLLLLLAVAAGATPGTDELGHLMASAGWRVDDAPPPAHAVRLWTEQTADALRLAGWNPGTVGVLAHDERARLVALLAIRDPA